MTDEASPWVLATEPASLGDPTNLVTLVDGQCFCLSGRTGDLGTSRSHGAFFADIRVLSLSRLLVDGLPVEPLAVSLTGATQATFVGRSLPPSGSSGRRLLVIRRRQLGSVLHEQIELRNTSPEATTVRVELEAAVDFADVFAVKEGRSSTGGQHSLEVEPCALLFRWHQADVHRQVRLSVSGAVPHTSVRGFAWELSIDGHGSQVLEIDLTVAMGTTWVQRAHHHPNLARATTRAREWLAGVPTLRTADRRLGQAYDRAVADVEALRLHDPSGRRRPVIAAGAPWFMTLFGRDALISSYMAIPVDPTLALGVLDALAELQGARRDPATEEEPGRIMHETRYLGVDEPTLLGGSTYYGSVDATPLFVVLLGELSRWGLPRDDLLRLLPAADRALQWIDERCARGHGYVAYERATPRGLANQGWKDSWDGIRYRDGRVADAPIALCEVQGYVYAARRARAAIARRLDDAAGAERHDHEADALRARFDRDFWLPGTDGFAVGLGADGAPIDSQTSNVGHCLWSGIVRPERAAVVVAGLLAADMWNGWGIRTLSSSDGGYDPMSYHCGTVWPHDTALCVAGLRAYGFEHEAWTVASGLLDAAQAWDGRLPELFCGLDRSEIETPVPFPTSCSPQAWAAAAPLLLLRVLLGLEPDGRGGLGVEPIEQAVTDDLALRGVRLFDARFDVTVDDGRASVTPAAPLDT